MTIHPHAAECPRRQDALDGRAEQARHPFTPGPWHTDFGEAFRIRESDGSSIAYTQFVHLNGRRDTEEVTANAKLIAAAPDLYEALAGIICWPSVRAAIGDTNTALAEAAIAKARGEA